MMRDFLAFEGDRQFRLNETLGYNSGALASSFVRVPWNYNFCSPLRKAHIVEIL